MTDERQITEYAEKVWKLAKDSIIVRFRFFDAALAKYSFVAEPGTGRYLADGSRLIYDPLRLLNDYKEEASFPVRLLLHVLFHSILGHTYRLYDGKIKEEYWNIACDIAVENIILDMEIPEGGMLRDGEERMILARLKKWVPALTAQALYREFLVDGISKDSAKKYGELFAFDRHLSMVQVKEERELQLSQRDWEKIAERLKAELKSFSRDVMGGESILMNLKESTRKRYDYDAILNRFAVMNEEIRVNPDEFDYIYYTYGLNEYHNMPLIEPLEYVEEKKIREFVIAVDTSASVRGSMVESFLMRTYDILEKSAAFSDQELCVHIIQCDSRVTSDVKIDSKAKLREVAANFQTRGFGATDFRPVFEYVDRLIRDGELKKLKGLIYFTDGYGIYPETAAAYDTLFVFNREDDFRAPVPGWAMKVIMEDEA